MNRQLSLADTCTHQLHEHPAEPGRCASMAVRVPGAPKYTPIMRRCGCCRRQIGRTGSMQDVCWDCQAGKPTIDDRQDTA